MNKKLTRSNSNVVFGGVAAGLGEYLDIDPTLVRLFFIFLALFGGHGLLVYFVLWILMPQEDVAEKIHVG